MLNTLNIIFTISTIVSIFTLIFLGCNNGIKLYPEKIYNLKPVYVIFFISGLLAVIFGCLAAGE